jgi:hypothetical protein
MPASSAHSVADPDEFASSVRASKVQLTLTEAGNFEAKIVRIDLHRLWLQRFDDDLPRVAHAANLKGRAIIMFRAGPGPELLRNGRPLELSELRRCADGQESYERSAGQAVRGAMSLPVEDLAEFHWCPVR